MTSDAWLPLCPSSVVVVRSRRGDLVSLSAFLCFLCGLALRERRGYGCGHCSEGGDKRRGGGERRGGVTVDLGWVCVAVTEARGRCTLDCFQHVFYSPIPLLMRKIGSRALLFTNPVVLQCECAKLGIPTVSLSVPQLHISCLCSEKG